jgi:dephospho-CoA kinase
LDAQPAAFTDSVSRNALVSGTWPLYASGELRVKAVHQRGGSDTEQDITRILANKRRTLVAKADFVIKSEVDVSANPA